MSKKSERSVDTRTLIVAAALETAGWFAKTVDRLLGGHASDGKPRAFAAAAQAGPPETGRCHDIDSDLGKGVNLVRRERWGTLFVVCAALVGFCAGVGFVYVYWAKPNDTIVLGGCLALCFGGFGVALVSWAHNLMRHKEAIEPREVLSSSPQDVQLAFDDFCDGKRDVKRRKLLTCMGVGFVGVFAASAVSLFRSLGVPPGPSLYDRVWKRGQRLMTRDGTPVSVDALQPGSTMLVYPEGSIDDERAQTVLIRVDEQFLHMPKERADWAPMGYLAYSRVCTHAGCPVGLYQKETHLLLCPCHQSTFDVLKSAQPTGGPAARPLPQVPLYADGDGMLRAGGGFSTPPGPGFWGMPA
jgi:ubiquinol-cytochrome c reductase iron-sulfur subunit